MDTPGIKYYNLSLTNNQQDPILASLTDRRTSSILEKPDEWEMSIVRFQICTNEVPLFKPVIPDPAFPLRTNMSITLKYLNNFFQQFIEVTAQEATRGIFDYNAILDHVNDASLIAFGLLKGAFPASDGTAAPLFYLNADTSLISMYTQSVFIQSNANRIQIGLNQPLQSLLNMPTSNIVLPSASISGFTYELAVKDSAILLPPTNLREGYPIGVNPIPGEVMSSSQEFRTLDEWNLIKAVIFTTALVPLQHEYLPNSSGIGQSYVPNNNQLGILTDFQIQKDNVEPTRGILTYVPPGEYRMISLMGTNPFSAIDVTASYQTYNGDIFPITLGQGENMSLKIMFRRKY
jgi:hypothetical protein